MNQEISSDKRTEKRRIGDIGESVACRYLERKGYRIVERNYLKPWGEIDIVAEKAELLSFIEVKTVQSESTSWQPKVTRESGQPKRSKVSREPAHGYIRPEENMHPKKLERLHRAVHSYLMEHGVPEDRPWQIDLACVYLDISAKRARVEMFDNVIL